MKEAKSFNQAITIYFSTKPSKGFFADKLTTNQQVFRVITAGQVTGDLKGLCRKQ